MFSVIPVSAYPIQQPITFGRRAVFFPRSDRGRRAASGRRYEERTMKRIARRTVLIGAVLLVLAIIGSAAVYGYFTSGRTIANNQVSAGTIQLTVNDDGIADPVSLAHLMPGDTGTAGGYLIKNIGDTPGTLWVGIYGDNTTGTGTFSDELGAALQVAYWLDVDGNGAWSGTDKYFVPDGHYVQFQTGDTPALPAGAYASLYTWNNAWSNSLDVPGGATAGTLRMTYLFPPTVDDLSLMGKSCAFDLMVELHQYHPETNTVTLSHVGSHAGATWAAYADGVLVDVGTVGSDGYVMTLPADAYSIVFTQGTWSWTKPIDISIVDQAFDMPA